MKLETKYGVLEGTVDEFRELLEGKLGRLYKLPFKGYKVVNKDIRGTLPKGTVLKHIIANNYEDTTGNQYIVHDNDLDDCNDNHIEGSFKNSKKLGTILKKVIKDIDEEYKIVAKDLSFPISGTVVYKDTVLKKLSEGIYVDSLGRKSTLSPEASREYLRDVILSGIITIDAVDETFKECQEKGELFKPNIL